MKILSTVLFLLLISCSQEYIVPVEQVDAHIKYLSSDEMNGRHPFGEEIKVAENYIISEYKKYGLKALPAFPDFKHEFELREVSIVEGSASVAINKKAVSDYFIVSNQSRSINNETPLDAGFEVMDLATNEKAGPNQIFGTLRKTANHKTLILLNAKQYDMVNGYKQYIPSKLNELSENGDRLVIIMKKPKSLKTISVSVQVEEKKHLLTNTIAYLEGTELKDEYVLFGAHHDHLAPSTDESKEDKIYNGADDDASGVTGVLALAEYFAKNGNNKRSIIFSTFTAEEMGLLGSSELAKNLPMEPEQVKAAVCLELIGGKARGGDGNAILTGYDMSDLGSIMQAASDTATFNLQADPYVGMNLFYRSDNVGFARRGIPAHTVSVTDFTVPDNTYHNVKDEYSTLNVPNMQRIIMGVAHAMKTVISGEKTPSRIDMEKMH
jgi:hypothetical protein